MSREWYISIEIATLSAWDRRHLRTALARVGLDVERQDGNLLIFVDAPRLERADHGAGSDAQRQ